MNDIIKIATLISVMALIGCNSASKQNNLAENSFVSAKGTDLFQPNETSFRANYKIPEWFRDAKFGIFIHWGVYAVPAFENEWYPRNMYIENSAVWKHHRKVYGDQTKFGYKDFIPMFKAEKFNANEWVTLFKKSGAKYIIPVAEHHDGFAMYDSKINPWNSVKMGPHKDILRLLKNEIEKQGLIFGLSSHRIENGFFFNGGMKFPSDVQDTSITLYGRRLPKYEDYDSQSKAFWLKQTHELIDNYQPQLMWFDWSVGRNPMRDTFFSYMAYYYNTAKDWGKEVVINTKFDYPSDIQVMDIERGKSDAVKEEPWQTDTSVGTKSWCYIDGEVNKSPEQIVHDLVDIVSKNGNLLLNIGPKADGTITDSQKNVLLNIGKWLDVNGEAIYSTRPFRVYGEGETKGTAGAFTDNTASKYTTKDVRFTTKGKNIFAIVLAWGKEITIKSLTAKDNILSISLLGSKETLKWKMTEKGLKISLPNSKPCEYAYTFKIIVR